MNDALNAINAAPKPEPAFWVLRMNDMRNAKSGELIGVMRAKTKGKLIELLERERVATYTEPKADGNLLERWYKNYRKGGPLEWCNLPTEMNEDLHFYAVDPLDSVIERHVAHMRQELTKQLTATYEQLVVSLPEIP